jgi:hypothetical protein
MYDQSFASEVDARRAAAAQAQIAPRINVNSQRGNVVAGVNRAPINKVSLGSITPITVVLQGGSADARTFAIGNPGDLVSSANSITVTNAAYGAGSSWTAAQLAEYSRGGFIIAMLNYEVDNASQFANKFEYASADIGVNGARKPLQGLLTSASRSTDQNLLIKTLDLTSFNGELVINRENALFLTVGAGRTATLTLSISAFME